MTELEQEFTKALAEDRQPNCVNCKKPLEVAQDLYDYLSWVWDAEEKRYIRCQDDGDAEKPECTSCGFRSWDFVDESDAAIRLGLAY